jgi:hypothetical protein
MMGDLGGKITKDEGVGIKPVNLSAMLKGLKGMRVTWGDLDLKLQDGVMQSIAKLCEEGKHHRDLSNAISYLGHLRVNWTKDVPCKSQLYDYLKRSLRDLEGNLLAQTLFG